MRHHRLFYDMHFLATVPYVHERMPKAENFDELEDDEISETTNIWNVVKIRFTLITMVAYVPLVIFLNRILPNFPTCSSTPVV